MAHAARNLRARGGARVTSATVNVLSVIWYTAAIGGAVAAIVGCLRPAWRFPALALAAACFGVAGVLGILSIGVVFIVLALGCLALAERSPARVV